MPEPLQLLFYGRGAGPDILLAGDGHEDGGEPIQVKVRTNPFIPAGEGGEALFTALWLTVTHTMACLLRVTVFVDAAPLTDSVYHLPLAAAEERIEETFEMGLATAIRDPIDTSVVLATVAPRGNRAALLVEVLDEAGDALAIEDGDLIFETPTFEYEVVRESRAAETPA